MKRVRTLAIVPAAGYGKRLGLKAKKPFVRLCGKPLVSYALKALDNSDSIDAIIVATEKSCIKKLKDIAVEFKIKKLLDVVPGGSTRAGSVRNCLDRIKDGFDVVLIHDAARPLVSSRLISDSVKAAARFGAAIAAVPESDTVKIVDGGLFIKDTMDRSKVFRAQTPQAFRMGLIRKAYSAGKMDITDDAGMVERAGVRVKVIMGSYGNIKVTTREDIKIAEVLLCG